VLFNPKTQTKKEDPLNMDILSPLIEEYLDLWETYVEEAPK
jgi:hypothetical protein